MAIAAVAFGLGIGISVGLLGAGGSVLAVPVLVYVLGQPVEQATTASLAVVTAAALAGTLTHHGEGRVCWRHAAALTLAAVPGIVAGTVAGGLVRPGLLMAAFAGVMLVAAGAVWRKTADEAVRGEHGRLCPPLQAGRDAAAGLGVGFLTGFFGIGGGFLIVPALALALGFRLRGAVGTSLAVISATSLIGLVVHLLAGRNVDVGITGSMTAACVVGALAGASVAGRVSQRQLGRAFAGVVATVAGYLLVAAAFLGGPPAS